LIIFCEFMKQKIEKVYRSCKDQNSCPAHIKQLVRMRKHSGFTVLPTGQDSNRASAKPDCEVRAISAGEWGVQRMRYFESFANQNIHESDRILVL